MEPVEHNDYYQIMFIFIFVFLLNISYVSLMCGSNLNADILETSLGVYDIDLWSVTHFVFFLFLGYLYPDHIFFIIFVGIVWEFIEYMIGLFEVGSTVSQFCSFTNLKNGRVSYGRISDVFINLAGYLVGRYIRLYV